MWLRWKNVPSILSDGASRVTADIAEMLSVLARHHEVFAGRAVSLSKDNMAFSPRREKGDEVCVGGKARKREKF